MPDLGLEKDELAAIIAVFRKYPAILRADIFGSRAKGGYKPYSDIDIAVYGEIDTLDVEAIICELDELPVTCKFDVVSYESIKNPALREHIDRIGVIIYEK